MAVPERVKKQAEEAARLQEGLLERNPGEESAPKEEPTEPQPAPGNPDDPAPKAEEHPKPTERDPGEPAPEQNHDWEKRFKQYKAHTDQTMFELRSELASVKQHNEQLANELKQRPTHDPAASDDPSKYLSEEELEDLGDFAPIIMKAARQIAREEGKALRSELDEVKQTHQKTTHERFLESLTDKVADWETVNEDPEFHRFLAEVDAYAGVQRQELLQDAQSKGDAARVARFFTDFKAMREKAAEADSRRVPDERIMPDNSRANEPSPASTAGRVWTQDSIKQFYAEKARGKYRGRDEEAKAIERDIFAAQQEGRIQP